MLIDAGHQEETRVVVLDNGTVAEFDFESQSRKQLRGNIYLAKVTRVEPSLQAAFVEYGGNRHGFLAFNEIHPDYYQIPVADREALIAEEMEAARQASDEADEAEHNEDGDDEDMAISRRRRARAKQYKIQEVIKRRQIMLIQVVKEERGAKGAALTTYLSLAGRYCVLMPNTARGGGVSRKITNGADRKRLKTIIQGLEVPQGMGLIIRTAGAKRTKLEIKRDYEYLLKEWDTIRETTLKSIAPALIYEEETLVKRAIRDLYGKDVDQVYVEGEDAYREAKDFIKTLSPSQAKKVQHYKDKTPLFVRFGVEKQLAAIHSPVVPLKSGGYIVINQTEALVAIDVNSGKATKERNIETTATKTNLEAATEAARQMRLRDLAGLIVIDFIDMEDQKNVRNVEKRLKDALKDDRARLQIGKMSSFGLMELSRQRRRTGVLESSTHICPSCAGLGRVRSVESSALEVLRAIETEAMGLVEGGTVEALVAVDVALFILNEKRDALAAIEARHSVTVKLHAEPATSASQYRIETQGEKRYLTADDKMAMDDMVIERDPSDDDIVDEIDDEEIEDTEDSDNTDGEAKDRAPRPPRAEGDAEGDARRKRRRRRRGRGRGRDGFAGEGEQPRIDDGGEHATADGDTADADTDTDASDETPTAEGEDKPRRPRRRRGKFGTRGPRLNEDGSPAADTDTADETPTAPAVVEAAPEPVAVADDTPPAKPKRSRAKPKAAPAESEAAHAITAAVVAVAAPVMETTHANPLDSMSVTHTHAGRATPAALPDFPVSEPVVRVMGEDGEVKRRGGWWQKKNPFNKA
jgi:ribonuclease E